MKPDEVTGVLKHGARLGCTEALFTFGERPEEVEGFLPFLHALGYRTILEYCLDMCRESIRAGVLPHTNAGVMTYGELKKLAPYNASMGLMLETTADLPAHQKSPGKKPEKRLSVIANAGRLKIPFTTGILVGIGETAEDRRRSLMEIARLHRRYGHIQEVIIQNFTPREGMAMAATPSPAVDVMCDTVKMAREILPDEIAVQIPPNLAEARNLLPCGATDLGGISPLTIDFINPDHPWPEFDAMVKMTAGYHLRERLCIYPRFIAKGWFHPRLHALIHKLERTIRERETG
jgi:FO synthase subunit 1